MKEKKRTERDKKRAGNGEKETRREQGTERKRQEESRERRERDKKRAGNGEKETRREQGTERKRQERQEQELKTKLNEHK
nr:hypothetical protein BgiMline_010479 [Biomphalaria glabrata]